MTPAVLLEGAVGLALGHAAGTSWERIVQVARQKPSAAKG